MRAEGWAECPSCGLPARAGAFAALLAVQPECPVCRAAVHPVDVAAVPGLAERRLKAYRG
jgi:uncharacterized protein (DUF983 family)